MWLFNGQICEQKLSLYNDQENYNMLILSKVSNDIGRRIMLFDERLFYGVENCIYNYLGTDGLIKKILRQVSKDLKKNNLYNKSFSGKEIIKLLMEYEVIQNLDKDNYRYISLYEKMIKEKNALANLYLFQVLLESMLFNQTDKIMNLSNQLMKNNLSEKIIFIKKDNKIIGKKIIRSNHLIPDYYKSDKYNWVPVWHGTKFESLESIMDIGLKLPGAKLKDGTVLKPLSYHIGRNITIDNIKDWANAIFVSQSIFYSADEAYANEIESNNKDWIVLVEGRAKIGSYYTRRHTFGNIENYKLLEGEPEGVEFRIEKESDIIVVSVLFVDKKYFRNIKEYKEGAIFANIDYEENNKDNYHEKEYTPQIMKKAILKTEESKNNEITFNPNYKYNDYEYEMKPYKKCKHEYYYDESDNDEEEEKKETKEIIINSIKYSLNYFKRKNIYIESKILKGDIVYQQKLIHWLKKPNISLESNNLENITLLYRGSRDGFKSSIFHEKCDKKGHTLVIIESTDNYIFGGYSSIDWESTTWNGKNGEDNNARRKGFGYEFVFTLKNPHDIPPSKFNMKRDWLSHSICCDVNLGPIFGCNDIRIEIIVMK